VVTYPAAIAIDNPEGRLRPGMTATVTVVTQRRTGVLRVPNTAMRFHPGAWHATAVEPLPPHTAILYLLRGGDAVPERVHTGVTDGMYTEVDGAGIELGTDVVTDEPDASGSASRARMRLF
jgi:HlyD family secretion protein